MELEVLLSVVDGKDKELNKTNITSKCLVINQCNKREHHKYKNFDVYCYDEIGAAKSRNRGLSLVTEDIILLCDDDVVYDKSYSKKVISAFKKYPDADLITFNLNSPNRWIKKNKKNRRIHFYNGLGYSSSSIAFKRESIIDNDIKFNILFGPNATYGSGEDTLFLVDALKNGLKLYASDICIGTVYHDNSFWFKGYNDRYFFDKGALFTAISYRFRHFLFFQYLLRHKEVFKNIGFKSAYKLMALGSLDYLKKNDKV